MICLLRQHRTLTAPFSELTLIDSDSLNFTHDAKKLDPIEAEEVRLPLHGQASVYVFRTTPSIDERVSIRLRQTS
jgi:hypothetical protein